MGIFSKWFGHVEQEAEQVTTETNEIWMRLSVSRKGDNVSIEMHGLGKVNVCLASFLTKGVSYAQEKYNEYKSSPKEIEPIEEAKQKCVRPSKREIEELRAWGEAQVKKGGRK